MQENGRWKCFWRVNAISGVKKPILDQWFAESNVTALNTSSNATPNFVVVSSFRYLDFQNTPSPPPSLEIEN